MGYLRTSTLGLFYFCKYVELIFLTIWTVLMIGSGTWLMQQVGADVDAPSQVKQLMYLIPICLVLSVFNIFYNNLLFNLRFSINLWSHTAGICLFKYVNWLFCSCVLEKPCKDRCCTPWTIVKWILKAGVFGYTIHVTRKYHAYLEEPEQEGGLAIETSGTGEFDTYLLVYVLQHVIFIVARIPIFFLFSILTCCCDKGQEWTVDEDGNHVDDPKFKDRIISYDYIQWQENALNNFVNHQVGFAEFEYNRNLASMRVQARAV